LRPERSLLERTGREDRHSKFHENPDNLAGRPDAVGEEIRWQLGRMSAAARAALRQLPPVGENPSGPLGPGLLGTVIRDLQASLNDPDHGLSRKSQADKESRTTVKAHLTERLA